MHILTLVSVVSLPIVFASPAPFHRRGGPPNKDDTVGKLVKTSSGSVAGHAAVNYAEVGEYLGIPYAKAPTGDLRFAPPVRFAGNANINGSSFGPACPHLPSPPASPPDPEIIAKSNVTAIGLQLFNTIANPNVQYSEDCLSLNVWTKQQWGEKKKAVMVFIHGGGFTAGTGATEIYNGAQLAQREDVIVVTLNYRLHILGFPGSPSSQTNLAILDQRLALEWVRSNIASFGGDPSRIILFGQSAGGASTDIYSYAFANDPIISSAILQSGTAFSFGLPYSAAEAASNWYTVTSAVGCGNSSTPAASIMTCMRSLPLDTILAAVPQSGLNAILSAFGPSADEKIVFSNYSTHAPAKIPIIVGSNDYEAGMFRTQLALGGMYFDDADWETLNLASYTCPAGLRANYSIAANTATPGRGDDVPIYRYRFFGIYPNTNISSEGGAYHGAELQLLFGTTFSDPANTPDETNLISYLQKVWTGFAKDPKKELRKLDGGAWPMYDHATKSLVRLGYEGKAGLNLADPRVYDRDCPDADLRKLICKIMPMSCPASSPPPAA